MRKTRKPRRAREESQPTADKGLVLERLRRIWKPHGWRLALLWALVLVAYSNSYQAGLVFDNTGIILHDPRIQDATPQNIRQILTEGYWRVNPTSGLYRPVTTLSYLVNYAVLGDGPEPAGYHRINVALHGLNVSLVYALGILVFGDQALALALAAIWGLHPLLTESVTNVVGRADLLAAFGVLAGLLCYAKSLSVTGRAKVAWIAALAGAQMIGLFSKENAAALPGILLLYDLIWSERATWRKRIPVYATLTIPFAVFFFLRSQLQTHLMIIPSENPLVGAGFWTARLTAIKDVGKLLWLFVWPVRLSADYSYNAVPLSAWRLASWEDAKTFVSLTICLGSLMLALRWRRTHKPLTFFIVFFFIALAPTSNVFILIGSILAERFMYLPAIGLAGCMVAAIHAIATRLSMRRAATAQTAWLALGLVCLVFTARTYARNFEWHDEFSLWTSAVNVSPEAARPHMNLGIALSKMPGRMSDAIAQYEAALRIEPDYAQAHYNLGNALSKMLGRTLDAIAEYQAVLRIQPDSADAHNNLGIALSQMPGRLADAMDEWKAALRNQPDHAGAHYNLGNALSKMPGRMPEAVEEWQAALRTQPDLADVHYNLGNYWSQMPDRSADAIAE
ncbi:MAG TPA: tetratricopeptide repeat protein, partial [Bryobacteraceae bacterium]|nr:tetratricopeptide repeat protein [Bryobacteraceae bacterium]